MSVTNKLTVITNSGTVERKPVWKADGMYIRLGGKLVKVYWENQKHYVHGYVA